jgi:hypothetical protein
MLDRSFIADVEKAAYESLTNNESFEIMDVRIFEKFDRIYLSNDGKLEFVMNSNARSKRLAAQRLSIIVQVKLYLE